MVATAVAVAFSLVGVRLATTEGFMVGKGVGVAGSLVTAGRLVAVETTAVGSFVVGVAVTGI
jgi:hypothetical protein